MPEFEIHKLRRLARVSLDREAMTIGRSSRNDVVLPHLAVSRQHCEIRIVDGVTRLADVGSTRGTRVNGSKVKDTVLRDGDRIEIGPFELTVRGTGHNGTSHGALDENPNEVSLFDAAAIMTGDDDGDDGIPLEDPAECESMSTLVDMPAIVTDGRGQRDLDRRRAEVNQRSREVSERERDVVARDKTLDARISELEVRERGLTAREESMSARKDHGRERAREASQRLIETQRSVATLETAFSETDAWLADATENGHSDGEIDRVVRQREALAEHLTAAVTERDEAIAGVVNVINEDRV